MRSIMIILGGWCWLGISSGGWAQDHATLFHQAQQAVAQEEYGQAQQYCKTILAQDAQHWDAHSLLTYAYAWEGDFTAAEQSMTQWLTALTAVDSIDQQVRREAMLCQVRLAYWQKNTAAVTRLSSQALVLFPDAWEFQLLSGKAAMAGQAYDTALVAFDQVLSQVPDHKEAQTLRDEAYWLSARYQAGLLYGHEIYTHSPFPRHTVGAELTRFWKQLTLTGHGSRSYRFDLVSHQLVLEAWKTLLARWYLYGQLGYSDGQLFPRFRAALEPFYKLSSSTEVSVGFRYLRYVPEDAWVYTASASQYFGQGSVTARTFWSPTPVAWRKSFEVGGRWFLPHEYNFVELKVGSGASPDNAYLDATYQALRGSRSYYAVVGAQRRFRQRLLGKVWAVLDRQLPTPGTPFSIISLNAGLWKRF